LHTLRQCLNGLGPLIELHAEFPLIKEPFFESWENSDSFIENPEGLLDVSEEFKVDRNVQVCILIEPLVLEQTLVQMNNARLMLSQV
jgi:hypothetical protein